MKKMDPIFVSIIMLILGLALGYFVKATPPGFEMKSAMHRSSEKLEAVSGSEFEKRFLEEMIVHHEGAVAMARLAQGRSDRQEVQEFANAVITVQTQEVAQMKRWLETWFGK